MITQRIDTYELTDLPVISEAELAALGEGECTPGATCGATRPGTLGYQRCWRISGHDGPHLPQDRIAWICGGTS